MMSEEQFVKLETELRGVRHHVIEHRGEFNTFTGESFRINSESVAAMKDVTTALRIVASRIDLWLQNEADKVKRHEANGKVHAPSLPDISGYENDPDTGIREHAIETAKKQTEVISVRTENDRILAEAAKLVASAEKDRAAKDKLTEWGDFIVKLSKVFVALGIIGGVVAYVLHLLLTTHT